MTDVLFIGFFVVIGIFVVYHLAVLIINGYLLIRDNIRGKRARRLLMEEFEEAGFMSGTQRPAIETDRFYR